MMIYNFLFQQRWHINQLSMTESKITFVDV